MAEATLCRWCKINPARADFCSVRCRVAMWRERRRQPAVTSAGGRYKDLAGVTRAGDVGVTPSRGVTSPAETVAALYVRDDGHYPGMDGVDAWTADRDATRYAGPWPVVAHPPCAPWGRYRTIAPTRQRADLAVRAVDQVRWYGGVLEHPASSHLWIARDMPPPGNDPDQWGGWAMLIRQSWWGHAAPKPTWLYIVGVGPDGIPPIPPPVPDPGGRIEQMEVRDREMTPGALAVWLVALARVCRPLRPPSGPGETADVT